MASLEIFLGFDFLGFFFLAFGYFYIPELVRVSKNNPTIKSALGSMRYTGGKLGTEVLVTTFLVRNPTLNYQVLHSAL